MHTINIDQKFRLFDEQWTPKIIASLNDQFVKLAKVENEFVWHSHQEEDELFLVWKGTLYIEFRDRTEIIKEGEMIVVPKGVAHRPFTKGEEVWIILVEPKDTKHTGDLQTEKTVSDQEFI